MGVYEYKVEGGDDWITLDILIKARELISDPERWTQEAFARDSAGMFVFAEKDDAVCWCGLGALIRVAGGDEKILNEASDILYGAVKASGSVEFANFNDTHTHAEVLAAFDRAIEAARQSAEASHA